MKSEAKKALNLANELADVINNLIPMTKDLDIQRLLKQIEADLMDVQHKLSMTVKLSAEENQNDR